MHICLSCPFAPLENSSLVSSLKHFYEALIIVSILPYVQVKLQFEAERIAGLRNVNVNDSTKRVWTLEEQQMALTSHFELCNRKFG